MFDLIIIGAGPGGYAAAEYAAHQGMNVALIERDSLGGTCLHRGCVPTKAYLHTAQVVTEAAVYTGGVFANFDNRAMLEQKNATVAKLAEGIAQLMKAAKVTVFQGHATLLNDNAPFEVSISAKDEPEQRIQAERILLATGSVPARIPVRGCDNSQVWTSDQLLSEAGAEPFESLLIVGGGVIGVEMASIYARLGVSVTIIEAAKRCLPMMDIDLSRSAEALLKGYNVQILTDAMLLSLDIEDGKHVALYEKNAQQETVAAQRALLATGRKPVTENLLADGVVLETNHSGIAVDDRYRTSMNGVYAIGDVNGRCQLAHAAHAQGIAAVSDMLGKPAPINAELVASCVYTSPEIASVGLTQEEAKVQGRAVVIGKALTTQNARTLIEGLGRGFIKLVFDKDSRQLLGAQLFCGRATDLVGELTLAIQSKLTAAELMRPLRPHPTFEEAITEAVRAARFV